MTTSPRNSAPTEHPSAPVQAPRFPSHPSDRHDQRLRLIDAATSCPVGRTKLARFLWEQAEALMQPSTAPLPHKVLFLAQLLRRLAALREQEDTMAAPRPNIYNYPWPRKFHTFAAEMNWLWYSSQEKAIQARASRVRAQAEHQRGDNHGV